MVSESLQNYIRTARSKHRTDDQIKTSLVQAGWAQQDVQMALSNQAAEFPPPPPPPSSIHTDHTNMWDAFEHILLFISLYVLATSIALALHVFVDQWMPGITDGYSSYSYLGDFQNTLLRGYLAAIIVSFPLFSFFFLRITKRTMIYPTLRKLSARKFFIYLTLVGTFIISLFNIITLVYSLLGGNVTLNFIMHFVVTVGISSGIFMYYLNEVKEDRKTHA